MTVNIVSYTVDASNTGNYSFNGLYEDLDSGVISGSILQSSVSFAAFDTATIEPLIQGLTDLSVTVSWTLQNYDVFSQTIDISSWSFSNASDQQTVEADTDNSSGTEETTPSPPADVYADIADQSTVVTQDVTDDSVGGNISVASELATAAAAGRDLFVGFSTGDDGFTYASNVTLTITGVTYIDLPIITGTASGQPVYDDLTTQPFANVALSDPSNTAGFGDTITITIEDSTGASTDQLGTLNLPGSPSALDDRGNGVYALTSGSTASLQAELDAIVFSPFSISISGNPVTATFDISYASFGGLQGTTNDDTTSVVITHDPRTITLSGAASGTDRTPFAALQGFTIVDPIAGDEVSATITVQTGTGALSGTGLTENADGTYSLAATTTPVLNGELHAVQFTPTPGLVAAGSMTSAEISLVASAADGWTGSAAESVKVTDVALLPTITGSGHLILQNAGRPFPTVQVSDSNYESTETIAIQLSNGGANGVLAGQHLNVFPNGAYSLTGTADVVTQELQGLQFTPTSPQPNSSVTTDFTLTDTTSINTKATDAGYSITVNTPAARPTISGGISQTVAAGTAVTPFASTVITDPNANSAETLTIAFNDALGVLSGNGLASPGGIDTLTGSVLQVNSELQGLVFTPAAQAPGSTKTTVFQLTDKTTPGTTTSDKNNSVTEQDTSVACYFRGTRILTVRGEVAIEALAIGDRVLTASGAERPVRWIARRAYGRRFARGRTDLLPVLIRAGALAENTPHRDLFVSPLHAMYLDGLLIPATALANGATIEQVESAADIEYFHLELDSHDVILAEGAPSESFVDCDSRGMFQNTHEFVALYPEGLSPSWAFCAERVERDERVDAVRDRLAARAEALGFRVARTQSVEITAPGIVDCIVAPEIRELHLVSPSHTPRNDRRRLGVAINALEIDGVSMALDDAALRRGFHGIDREGLRSWRWTDGDAVLRLDPATHPRGMRIHVVSIASDEAAVGRTQTVKIMAAGRHRVTLAPDVDTVCLWSPGMMADGDARRLGAALTALRLDGATMDLDGAALGTGFHPAEQNVLGAWRWTDGDAVLRVAPAVQPRELAIEVTSVAMAALDLAG